MYFSMPGLNGPEATKQILAYLNEQADEEVIRPSIYCFSAYTDKEFKKNAKRAGMDGFYAKLTSKE